MTLPTRVTIFEVGPRDGLQNEPGDIPFDARMQLIDDLADAGHTAIEAGSFVSPKAVPQMAQSDRVFEELKRRPGVRYAALTPNMRGFDRALACGADEVAIFAAASNTFSQRNINCTIEESLERFGEVARAAQRENVPVRGYVSCVVGCPYEGKVAPAAVADVTARLLDLGCYEVSLGDTNGAASAGGTARLLEHLLSRFDAAQLALHCHDTYGQALGNILVALQHGIATVDSSIAGLGGCPYSPGATGNVATEDVVYMLDDLGIETGLDLEKLIAAGQAFSQAMGRDNTSRVARARLASQR
jgi:hydroxymethylglutaryl-CoA lyase